MSNVQIILAIFLFPAKKNNSTENCRLWNRLCCYDVNSQTKMKINRDWSKRKVSSVDQGSNLHAGWLSEGLEEPDLNSFLKTVNIDGKWREKKRKKRRRGALRLLTSSSANWTLVGDKRAGMARPLKWPQGRQGITGLMGIKSDVAFSARWVSAPHTPAISNHLHTSI